jgi:hypothetical protein
MKHLRLLWLVIFGSLALAAAAQDTNSLRTSLGQFEARTGVVIVRGYAPIGSIPAGPVEISVRCKETTDVGSGEKAYGLAFELSGSAWRDRTLVDDDEIDALLEALNYVIKSNYEVTNDKVTSLTSFEASYTTKAGLRVMANSVRKEGGVQYFIQSSDTPRIPLSGVEMTQLYNLVSQARKNLGDLKSGK